MSALRTLSATRREWLVGELDVWREAGLVGKPESAKILALYEPQAAEEQRQHQWFLVALGGIAATMLFAAVALLVSYNWDALTAGGKLVIVFGALVGIYAAAALLWRVGYERVSEVVIFFGGLFFGAAIWLIAQIFHMESHYPDGYFFWALGVLPLALIFDTLLLHALFTALIAAWVGTEILSADTFGAVVFGRRLPVANGAYLAPLLLLPGLWNAYRRNSPPRLTLYLPALVWWICLQPIAWRMETGASYFIAAVGVLLLILAESHLPRSKMAITYRVLGALLFGAALIPLSYHQFASWTQHEPSGRILLLTFFIVSLTLITVTAAEFVRYRALETGNRSQAELVEDIRRRQWLPLSLAGVTAFLALCSLLRDSGGLDAGIVSALFANLAMLALAIWLMRVGVRDNRARPFVGGVGYFLLWVILRYIDLFGIAGGMLGAAALFAACGVAIGGLAWFWQQRHEVIHVHE